MQGIFHPEQLLPFAFQHPFHRNTSPFSDNLCNILRRNCLCDNRILYCSLTFQKTFYLVLGFRHLSITDLCYLAVVTCSLCIMGFNLIIFNPLPCLLKLRENLLLLIPPLPQIIPMLRKFFQFRLDLVCLEGNTLPFHSLFLNLQLTNAAFQLCNRFWNRIHLKTKL